MLKLAKLAAVAMAGALASAPVFSADKAAATVNGVAIPQARLDAVVKEVTSQGQQADSPQLRQAVLDRLINFEVLSQEALKQNLDKEPDVIQQMELARQTALAGALVQRYTTNHPASEDALKAEYDKLKNDPNNTQYKVAHILLDSEADAKAVAAQLKKKGKFEAIAKEKSKDPGSKDRGGELGWHAPSDFVPAFAEALAHLKKGEVSAPVQSENGWHIIKVEDVRTQNIPPFEQAKPFLMQRMQQQSIQKLIADLRKNAKIEGVKAE